MVAPRANTTRMEDFEVQRKLGQGSFGVVYAVTRKRDLTKRRTFVIKQVELGPRRSEQEAAIDECRVLSKMDSKYVVKYFESFITKGTKLCIVMEYAPKVRHRRVRLDERPVPSETTTRVPFLQVAIYFSRPSETYGTRAVRSNYAHTLNIRSKTHLESRRAPCTT